jgi:hypothetical protein
MRTKRLLQIILGATLLGSAARADQITFTMTGDVNGTLGGTPFSDALLTVTSVADTNNVSIAGGTNPDYLYELIAGSSTVSIAGVTTPGSPATFSGTTFWEDPNGSGDIIFGDESGGSGFACVPAGCPVLGFVNFSLSSYKLNSSIGPETGYDFPVAVFDAFENIPTSAGLLSIPEATNSVRVGNTVTQSIAETFTAEEVTPEPTPVVLLGLAFGCLIGFRKAQRFKRPA